MTPIEVAEELDAVKKALDMSQDGDLLICLVKGQREDSVAEIRSRMQQAGRSHRRNRDRIGR